MKKTVLILAATGVLLSACESTPDPGPQVPVATNTSATIPPPPPPAPPPPVSEVAPVVVDNSGAFPPAISGPTPGSMADFMNASGGEGRVFFAYNQHDLSGSARSALAGQAQWLQNYPQVIAVIEGNADERGTREYNLALAARRAESVKSYLVSQGVSPNRLTTVSYGKERPIDGRASEEGWSRNRNAHTNLMSGTIG